MLVEFAVTNYRSIRDEVRLSLVASRDRDRSSTHVMSQRPSAGRGKQLGILRTVAIYGPNAGGKTNLLRALQTMQEIVVRSSRNIDKPLSVEPFLFDPEPAAQPTIFDVTIILGGVRYQYGFSATREAVHEEWLYAWPFGREQSWFERRRKDSGDFSVKFGDKLLGDKAVWHRATRSNALILSVAASLNSVQLKPIWDWFNSRLHTAGGGWDSTFTLKYCDNVDKKSVVDFLTSADIAINDLRIVEEDFSEDMLLDDIPQKHRELLIEELKGERIRKAQIGYTTKTGESIELDLEEESAGTQKMLALAGPWLDSFERGNILVIDELEEHLHPKLVRFLVEKFHDPEANSNGAQLVFSTHNTSILGQEVFRRDQIWFCERGGNLATTLKPLTDFKPRKQHENLERAYLSGRYGAVPFLRRPHQKALPRQHR